MFTTGLILPLLNMIDNSLRVACVVLHYLNFTTIPWKAFNFLKFSCIFLNIGTYLSSFGVDVVNLKRTK